MILPISIIPFSKHNLINTTFNSILTQDPNKYYIQ